MLSCDEFKQALLIDLRKRLGDDTSVETSRVRKNNGVMLDGIKIQKRGCAMARMVYFNQYYQNFKEGQSVAEIGAAIAEQCGEGELPDSFDPGDILVYEKVKDSVYAKLINVGMNAEMLSATPHCIVEDLAVVFYYEIGLQDGGAGCIGVTGSMLDAWGISLDELQEQAFRNLEEKKPAMVKPMDEVLQAIAPDIDFSETGLGDFLWVATNESGNTGAICALYPGVLHSIAERLDSDLFVLPSSIHEMMIVRADGEDPVIFQELVQSVNREQVPNDEKLSDSVYRYSRESDELKRVV